MAEPAHAPPPPHAPDPTDVLPAGRMESGASGVWSEVLGLWAFLKGEDGELRWYDPEAGKELETPAEVHAAREAEAAAREAAEEKLAELAAQSSRTYSKSIGWWSMPREGGAIQLANLPGPVIASGMSERT